MILDKCKIVIVPSSSFNKQRKQLQLTQDSDFKWLLQEASNFLGIDDAKLDFIIRIGSAEILLNRDNFQYFKKTAHLNKIIRIFQHQTQEMTLLPGAIKRQIDQMPNLSELKELQSDYASFFADGLTSFLPMLNDWGLAIPASQFSVEQQLSEPLIQGLGDSLQPLIAQFLAQKQ